MSVASENYINARAEMCLLGLILISTGSRNAIRQSGLLPMHFKDRARSRLYAAILAEAPVHCLIGRRDHRLRMACIKEWLDTDEKIDRMAFEEWNIADSATPPEPPTWNENALCLAEYIMHPHESVIRPDLGPITDYLLGLLRDKARREPAR